MINNKLKYSLATGFMLFSSVGHAALAPNSILSIEAGSNFTMSSGVQASITGFNGLHLGTTQLASGSHSGSPDGSESPNIDNPWEFLFSTGMHQSNSPTNVLSTSGNTATVDFSGWGFTWNAIPNVPLGTGAWAGNADGVANITCAVDCGDGDTYTLIYSATVPTGDPSDFGDVRYYLQLKGTISAVPLPAGAWLFGSGLLGLIGLARKKCA